MTTPILVASRPAWLAAALFASSLGLASCNTSNTNEQSGATAAATDSVAVDSAATAGPRPVKPAGPSPAWAPNIGPEMQTVIEKLAALQGPTPPETLTPAEVRKAPSATDATMAVMQDFGIPTPPSPLDTMSKEVAPGVKARIYIPKGATGPLPVVVYYHGGGWVIANLDTYHPSVRALAEKTNAVFVSVAYRQAPENKFPTAHNDSFAAYQWVLKNAAAIKGDPKRVAVAGESAGGNLAAAVCMMARDKGIMQPKHQLLVYPIADYSMNTPSYQKNAQAKPLSKPFMGWFFKHYLRTPADGNSPLISLVKAPNVKGLAPATVITAGIDPLMSEGKAYADKLQAAGIPVKYQNYDNVTHEFFGMGAVVPQAKEAQDLAAGELKNALK
ncbi:alpha/beta hydrolase [Hymenobacter cellulosivorans]|uniref:Alpha/beta hydrolase fold domain-containing protein n=1 Tax=Hymenobacter cellulosivorans TaxID=2932249 RepID=A0ABY4FBA9_9BACT|nr:alpha/beta hydrolase [Hymenobacter cellulosivorans]UOQ53963.1 alpha/beta hydrolase fold domain-containing protein [Hymenobacter cellulosivorans]